MLLRCPRSLAFSLFLRLDRAMARCASPPSNALSAPAAPAAAARRTQTATAGPVAALTSNAARGAGRRPRGATNQTATRPRTRSQTAGRFRSAVSIGARTRRGPGIRRCARAPARRASPSSKHSRGAGRRGYEPRRANSCAP
jgi:hypothetical protein